MKISLLCLVSFLGLSCARAASTASDANWPQWRGPDQNGSSSTAHPPTVWSETENIRWKIKIPGSGTASPIVWGNQVFVETAIPTGKKMANNSAPANATANIAAAPAPNAPRRRGGPGGMRSEKPTEAYQFALLAMDRQSGKILWQKVAREETPHQGHHPTEGSFASSSPVTDGKSVFAYFGSRGLFCYDLAGNVRWEKDLGKMQTKMDFGEGSSPALFGNTLVVTWDHEGDDFIVAFDKDTGRELWRQARDEDTSWATPLIVAHGDKPQVVTAATKKVRSYDLATGKLLWECGGLTPNAIPSPVAGDGMVYVTSGFRGSALLAIRLGRTGDLTGSDAIVWSYGKDTPYVPSPLLYGGKLYLFASNNNILSSFDAKSGKGLINAERVEGLQGVYASPLGAGGHVYLVGRNGVTAVIKPSDQLEIVAKNKLDDRFDASPAAAGKELFLRGHEYLYCVAEK